jgi:ABC-type lipoprotein release transport system permease subunit
MPVIFNIAIRNLVRQKRRNLLLGVAIAFGAMVLIMANAFSHGIAKVLFDQVVSYTNGHVAVTYSRNGNMTSQVFYDDARVLAAVKKAAPPSARIEEAAGVFARAIGNGIADNVIMVGVDLNRTLTPEEVKHYASNFSMLQGSFLALKDTGPGCPVIISEQKAKYLRVKMGDVIRVRFTGVNNQASSAQLTIVGVFKPANVFMASPVFLELHTLKALLGYGPHDIASVRVNVKDPQRFAKSIADGIHAMLKPGLAVMTGTGVLRGTATPVTALGFRTDSASQGIMHRGVPLSEGDSAAAFGYRGVIVAKELAAQCHAGIGDTLALTWYAKFGPDSGHANFVVTAVAGMTAKFPSNGVFINERDFYHAYYAPLPHSVSQELLKTLPDSSSPLYPALAPEFMLMKRCSTTDEYTKMMEEMGRGKFKGIMVSVQSMYETASAILQVEAVLNLITLAAGLILFFIILIGVINTLRMTIRERTREIGTIRAIGMQRSQVLIMFLVETLCLAFVSSLAGAVAAFAAMGGLTLLTINAADNPMGMLLVNGHLFFAPTAGAVAAFIVFITALAGATAFFPARRAAKLTAANAMRHYE